MVLITGVTGTVGKAVLAEVARSGVKHRAMHRSEDEAAKVVYHTGLLNTMRLGEFWAAFLEK
jgi:uncharacterized protein YbjT (DUF2867 family)